MSTQIEDKPLGQATMSLHSDRSLENGMAVAPAIHQSVNHLTEDGVAFAHKATEPLNDQFYCRHGNPTSSRIAKIIADLEGSQAAMMFASGMSAITTTILTFVENGDHIIAQENLYSATASFLSRFLPKYGVDVTFVDQRSIESFERAITPKTKIIYVETPSNPLLSITDIRRVSELAIANNVITICDNTLATPINQKPIGLGVDLVVHSATKYIGGHHDLLAGCVTGPANYLRTIWDVSMDLGPIAAPFNSWLALRGVRTLKLRVLQHNSSALLIAQQLEEHPKVGTVYYPGLTSHPQHDLARKQMRSFGGILTFDMLGGYEAAGTFIQNTQLCMNAPSLGGVDTLVSQPAVMFSARLNKKEIQAQDIRPGMIRMSVGIEDVADLQHDIDRALFSI